MDLKGLAIKISDCAIWSLTYNGELLGFRVKSFDIVTNSYVYYDFDKDVVKNIPEYVDFFKDKCKQFDRLPLKSINGRLYTKEEADGIYEAKELTTKEETSKILKPVILLYKGGVLDV